MAFSCIYLHKHLHVILVILKGCSAKTECCYLVLARPEGADSQLHLVPLVALGARDVPDGAALGAPVDPDEHVKGPGAVAVSAVQEVAELDAVGVVLAERPQQHLGALAGVVLRAVDHHEGAWRRRRRRRRGGGVILVGVHHVSRLRVCGFPILFFPTDFE